MSDCIFCNFSNIKVRTIDTALNIHVVASLGQITDSGYLILIPMKHSPCIAAMKKGDVVNMQEVLDETITVLEEEYKKPIIVFEHGIVGQSIQHSHLHLVPANFNLTPLIKADFPNNDIELVKNLNHLKLLYKKRNVPYLFWSTPHNEHLVCWNPPAPPEYLRLQTAKLLKVPERGKWREMDEKLDKKLITQTIEKLTPIFAP